MSLRKIAVSGIGWTSFQQFGTQGIGFIISIFMARLLLPAEFGLIGMITVFIGIGASLINSGLTQSLIRSENPNQEDYSTVFFFNLIGSIIIYFLLFFAAPFIADFYNQQILINIIRIYCLSFILRAFSAVQLTRLTKEMNFKIEALVSVPSLIVSGGLGIYLAYKGYGVWSLVWAGISQAFLYSVQLWWRTGWRPSLIFNKEKFKFHFHYGYKLTLSGLLDTVFVNIYQIIIGKFFVASQVGFYTRANTLKQLPVINISNILDKVSFPLFASINNDDVRLKRAYKQIMEMVVFVIAPVLIIMGVLAEPLFRFMFTSRWLPAVPYFQILCLEGILYPIHGYNLNILKVKGRSDLFLKLEIIKKVLLVGVILITIQYGIIGLIWGQLFSSIFAFFINTHYSGKFIQYTAWEQVKDILPIILLAFLAGSCVWGIDHIMKLNGFKDIFRILLGSICGTVSFVGLIWLLKRELLMNLIRTIRKHK